MYIYTHVFMFIFIIYICIIYTDIGIGASSSTPCLSVAWSLQTSPNMVHVSIVPHRAQSAWPWLTGRDAYLARLCDPVGLVSRSKHLARVFTWCLLFWQFIFTYICVALWSGWHWHFVASPFWIRATLPRAVFHATWACLSVQVRPTTRMASNTMSVFWNA